MSNDDDNNKAKPTNRFPGVVWRSPSVGSPVPCKSSSNRSDAEFEAALSKGLVGANDLYAEMVERRRKQDFAETWKHTHKLNDDHWRRTRETLLTLPLPPPASLDIQALLRDLYNRGLIGRRSPVDNDIPMMLDLSTMELIELPMEDVD